MQHLTEIHFSRKQSHAGISRRTALVSVIVVVASLAACSRATKAPTAISIPEVTVTTVHRSTVPVTTDLPARTSPYRIAQVRARVDGIVTRRMFDEGTNVAAGQRLYLIDPAPYVAALDSASAALQKAQATLASTTALAARDEVLVAANAVSKQDYDNAVAARGQAAADVASGKAAVETARINLGYTGVTSPIAGRTSASLVTQGAYVQASAATLLTTVQQLDPIYVDMNEASVDGLRLRKALAEGRLRRDGSEPIQVRLTLEDGTTYPLSGTLEFTGTTVDESTGSVSIRARFPNPNNVLLPGMFVHARVNQGIDDRALLVPQVGVTHDAKGAATVFVVGTDDKVAQRSVQTTGTIGDQWVVVAGLADGDHVVVAGAQRTQPGMTVMSIEAPVATASAGTQSPLAAAAAPN
jgi:membrane fusion protein, multidrug efflux system